MIKRVCKFLLIVAFLPLSCLADVINIKSSAPDTYVVKKGDTLWDISAMYLDKPWLWPELWRTNTHIENPHLIYPGDELSLTYDQAGNPVLSLTRNTEKRKVTLSPQMHKTAKREPIPVLPFSVIAPYIDRSLILSQQAYQALPKLMGTYGGNVRFAEGDQVLTSEINQVESHDLAVVRHEAPLKDSSGRFLGHYVRHVAEVETLDTPLDSRQLVEVKATHQEIKRGDRLMVFPEQMQQSLALTAAENQRGEIVKGLQQHSLLGKYDVVAINLGRDEVVPGNVLGIYQSGPDIVDGESPVYKDEQGLVSKLLNEDSVKQPALKVGELVVFETFEQASLALIIRSTEVIRPGAMIAHP